MLGEVLDLAEAFVGLAGGEEEGGRRGVAGEGGEEVGGPEAPDFGRGHDEEAGGAVADEGVDAAPQGREQVAADDHVVARVRRGDGYGRHLTMIARGLARIACGLARIACQVARGLEVQEETFARWSEGRRSGGGCGAGERGDDGEGEEAEDDGERGDGADGEPGLGEHFQSGEGKDGSEAEVQEAQALEQMGEQKEERAQAHDGHDV